MRIFQLFFIAFAACARQKPDKFTIRQQLTDLHGSSLLMDETRIENGRIDKRLLVAPADYLYTLIIDERFIVTIPIGMLQENCFCDLLSYHYDQSGTIYHVDYTVIPTKKRVGPDPVFFNTQVEDIEIIEGERPQLLNLVQESEKKVVEQSFFAKYWYYFVPVVLFVIASSAQEDEPTAKK